eukprot:1262626-Prymnesium_polylepis.1
MPPARRERSGIFLPTTPGSAPCWDESRRKAASARAAPASLARPLGGVSSSFPCCSSSAMRRARGAARPPAEQRTAAGCRICRVPRGGREDVWAQREDRGGGPRGSAAPAPWVRGACVWGEVRRCAAAWRC